MTSIAVGKYIFQGTNHQEMVGLKKEIFNDSIYYVDLSIDSNRPPLIIDAGAHVGVASLYFKQQWPDCHIICIEPHPELAELLRQNIWQNQLKDIEVIEAALADKEGTAELYFDKTGDKWYSTASYQSGAWDHTQSSTSITVKTIPLDSLLKNQVDLLKLDVEGSEINVLRHAKLLHHLENIVIELHPPHTAEDINKIFRKTHNVVIKKHHYDLKLCYVTKKK